MGYVGDVGDIADMPIGRNAIFVGDVGDITKMSRWHIIQNRIISSIVLSSEKANYKNDIQ